MRYRAEHRRCHPCFDVLSIERNVGNLGVLPFLMIEDGYEFLFSAGIQHRSRRHPRRFPSPATAVEFLRSHSHRDQRGALIAIDHVELGAHRLIQDHRQIIVGRTRSRGSHLEFRAGFDDFVHGLETGMSP